MSFLLSSLIMTLCGRLRSLWSPSRNRAYHFSPRPAPHLGARGYFTLNPALWLSFLSSISLLLSSSSLFPKKNSPPRSALRTLYLIFAAPSDKDGWGGAQQQRHDGG